MKGEMHIISALGSVTSIPYNRRLPYDHLKIAVGGWLELVPYFNVYEGQDCRAYCDEEGKMKGLPRNDKATELWHAQWPVAIGSDHLVGNVVVITGDSEFMRSA